MLECLLGSLDAERTLLFLAARGEGYGRQIADFWQVSQTGIRLQLARLEQGGVLVHRATGRTLVYTWNPRWPFRDEIQALLNRALELLNDDLRQRLTEDRRRPRRHGRQQTASRTG
jgi:predicted ArsR family transcriptional regulator